MPADRKNSSINKVEVYGQRKLTDRWTLNLNEHVRKGIERMNVVVGGASGIGAAVATIMPEDTIVADRTRGDIACDLTDVSSLDALAGVVDRLEAAGRHRRGIAGHGRRSNDLRH